MKQKAEEARADADAATRKAQLLTPQLVEENDAVKAATAGRRWCR